MAVGDAATGRAVPVAGSLGRARLSQDRAVEAAQGLGRPQRRPGAGALARATRAHDCSKQRPLAGLRQFICPARLALRRVLPAPTGGSFALRRLYTDDEEVLFEATRPILLNGIEDVIKR